MYFRSHSGFVVPRAVDPARMSTQNDPPATPEDATKATDGQRALQDDLDHRDDDPEAPGGHQDRHDVADET